MLLIGATVLLVTMAVVLLGGLYLLRIPFDDLLGVASGVTGNPAILVYATRMAPTDRPDIGYAMIFPSATIIRVVAVRIRWPRVARALTVVCSDQAMMFAPPSTYTVLPVMRLASEVAR